MKISIIQPLSAFSVYSEKLRQKKKKTKPQVLNGVGKIKKPEANAVNKPKKSADKKTQQMKEIGYILQKLAERSANTSSPKAAAPLNCNCNMDLMFNMDDSLSLQGAFKDDAVAGMEQKAKSLKRKKGNRPTNKSVKSNNVRSTKHMDIESSSGNESSCIPAGSILLSDHKKQLVVSDKALKKDTSSLKKGRHRDIESVTKASTKSKTNEGKLRNEKLSKIGDKMSNVSGQIEIRPNKMEKRRLRHNNEITDITSWKLFEWLISPIAATDFMGDFWEKKPLLIKREGIRNYFSELLSTEAIDVMLRDNNVCFTKHLDITSYTDGLRETHNLTGRAQANVVWDFYSNGCSVRLLNPQIFLPKIHALNATLQEYFGCFVGTNVYLTPPNSQGFAPHYDDIEAFVLQIEGKKRWKVYTPRTDADVLPRFSSPNLTQEELEEPYLDVTLEPGDLLYFPRGFIHQATTVEGEHSLHITLSAYQKTAWIDLMEKVLPIALKRAAENDVEFRRGLPRDYLGLEYRGSSRQKQSFADTAQSLMEKLSHYVQLSLGAGVDQMGAQFMHDALPPMLAPDEKQNSSVGGGLKLRNGKLEGRVEFQLDTCVKLTRYNICRLAEEEDEVRLYHCLDNSLEYHGEEPQFLVLPPEGIQVITQLQTSYPAYVPLHTLPHEDPEALIVLISDLWDAGLLLAKDLPIVEES